jgi:hypothetical protein
MGLINYLCHLWSSDSTEGASFTRKIENCEQASIARGIQVSEGDETIPLAEALSFEYAEFEESLIDSENVSLAPDESIAFFCRFLHTLFSRIARGDFPKEKIADMGYAIHNIPLLLIDWNLDYENVLRAMCASLEKRQGNDSFAIDGKLTFAPGDELIGYADFLYTVCQNFRASGAASQNQLREFAIAIKSIPRLMIQYSHERKLECLKEISAFDERNGTSLSELLDTCLVLRQHE